MNASDLLKKEKLMCLVKDIKYSFVSVADMLNRMSDSFTNIAEAGRTVDDITEAIDNLAMTTQSSIALLSEMNRKMTVERLMPTAETESDLLKRTLESNTCLEFELTEKKRKIGELESNITLLEDEDNVYFYKYLVVSGELKKAKDVIAAFEKKQDNESV